MIHSSYDNLSLISPNVGSSTTNNNSAFDELQGLDKVSFILLFENFMLYL